jgi:hypothetical protein
MNRRRHRTPRESLTPVPPVTLADFTAVFGMGTGLSLPLWPPLTFIFSFILIRSAVSLHQIIESLRIASNRIASTSIQLNSRSRSKRAIFTAFAFISFELN